MIKRFCASICAVAIFCSSFCGLTAMAANNADVKYNFKLAMESDSDYKSLYGYNGGTISTKKSYVAGKYGNALQITYPGHQISNSAKRYNGYVLEFKSDKMEVGNEQLTMLELLRDTQNISMWVHTPITVDHGNGAAANRTIEFIFSFNTTEGEKKFSKKFQLPNRGEWEYITLPVSAFKSGSVTMNEGIQAESYTDLSKLTISFPYKDYFGANPDESTLETPWEEPFILDEMLFDRSTDSERAITPPSSGEEEYFENANIKNVLVNGVQVSDFDPSKKVNDIAVPSYYDADDINANVTIEVEAPYVPKTNKQQELSGATYEISAPNSVPGSGEITVTSASRNIKKKYNVRFVARSGLQIDLDDISFESGIISIPIVNESSSGSSSAVVLVVSKNSDGSPDVAAISESSTIAGGETVVFNIAIPQDVSANAEIYVFNNETDYKLMCQPVMIGKDVISFTEPGGTLKSFGSELDEENNIFSINADATGDGTAVLILKNDGDYAGAYTLDVKNGKLDAEIKLGDVRGSITAILSYGNIIKKTFYSATEDEITSCEESYASLGTDTDENLSFFNEYKDVLNLDNSITDTLSESEIASIITDADKSVNDIDEIRQILGEEILVASVNKSNSADLLMGIYKEYNDIARFDSSEEYFGKYITDDCLSDVFENMADNSYNDIDELRNAFCESGLLVALGEVNSYGETQELIEDNQSLLEGYISYSDLRNLSSSDKIGFYKYAAEKGKPDDLSELGEWLDEYIDSDKSSEKGGSSSSGGGVAITAPVTGNIVQKPQIDVKPVVSMFSDVDETHWAYSSINGLKKLGIVDGYDDGSFGINNNVTREEFVKMLLGAFGEPITDDAENVFKDVEPASWYAPYVNTAAALGVVSGIEDDVFGTGMKITRQDMSVLIARFLEKKGFKLDGTNAAEFSDDADIADYAVNGVYALKSAGLISGMDNNCFAPMESATRAQTAKILYSVYTYIQNGGENTVDISGDDRFSVLARKFIALGMIDVPEFADETISRGQFAEYVAGFANAKNYNYNDGIEVFGDVPVSHRYYNEIRYLAENGYIDNQDNNYAPDEPISMGEVAVILTRLMGYDFYAVEEGGDINSYYSVANRYEIIPKMSKSVNDTITFSDVLEIFDSAAEAYILINDSTGINVSYRDSDITALYYFHDVLVTEDVVYAVGSRSVDGRDGANGIRIGESVFETELKDAYRYLGYRVKAFYNEDSEKLLFPEPVKRNEILTVAGDMISDYNGSELEYYKNETSSAVKTENITKSMNRMFNYNHVADYSEDDVLTAEEIIFIDNNGDGDYETVNVINESIYCVNQVSSYDGTIYDYYSQIPLKTEDLDSALVFDENKNLVSLSAVETYDVLSVISDKQGENIIIYICRDEIEGIVESKNMTDEDKTVVIDGITYELADELASEPSTDGFFEIGGGVTVLLDRHGRAAYVEINDSINSGNFAYLIKAVSEEPGVDPFLRVYVPNSGIEDLKLARRAVINGTKVLEETDLNEIFVDANITANSVNQLIRYKLNDNGEIQSVKTASYIKGADLYTTSSVFTRMADMEDSYYNATYRAFPGFVRVDSNTVIMNVPSSADKMSNESYYGITEFKDLKSQTFDKVEMYNMSKDMTAGILVVRSDSGGGKSLTYSSPMAAIKEIETTVVDGEERYEITLLYNGSEQVYNTAEGVDIERQYKGTDGAAVTSTLDEGDLIRFATNSNDEITDYHKVFDFDNQDDAAVVIRGNEYGEKNSYIGSSKTMISFEGNAANPAEDVISGRIWQGKNPYWFTGVQYSTEFGIVKEIHGTTMIIQTYAGTEGSNKVECERYFNLKNNRVYILEDSRDGVRVGSVNDIVPADLAGEENASRVIISRHNDVPSIAAIVNR